MFGGEIVEREQNVSVFGQFRDGFLVFHAVSFDEDIEGSICFGLRLGLPYVMQVAPGFGLHGFGHGILRTLPVLCNQQRCLAVDPNTSRRAPRNPGAPESRHPVADGQIRGVRKAVPLQVKEQLQPALGAFAVAVRQAQYFLAPPFVRANEDQNTLFFLHPGLKIHAICPDMDDAPGAEIAFLPAFIIRPPIRFEPRDGGG